MAIAIILCQAEKAFKTHNRECAIFENWLNPVSGSLPFKDIAPIHIEKIKKTLKDAEMSARTVQYVLAVIRQVFNTAYRHGIYIGLNPVKQVSKQKADNKRARFLTSEEIWVHHQQACPKRKGQ